MRDLHFNSNVGLWLSRKCPYHYIEQLYQVHTILNRVGLKAVMYVDRRCSTNKSKKPWMLTTWYVACACLPRLPIASCYGFIQSDHLGSPELNLDDCAYNSASWRLVEGGRVRNLRTPIGGRWSIFVVARLAETNFRPILSTQAERSRRPQSQEVNNCHK